MRIVLQVASRASVTVGERGTGEITGPGIVALVGVTHSDTPEIAAQLAAKIAGLRILPHFGGDIVTSPRSQAYYLATEYGVVNLAGRSTWERAEALVSIAHPDFREQLIAAAESQKIWRRSAKR